MYLKFSTAVTYPQGKPKLYKRAKREGGVIRRGRQLTDVGNDQCGVMKFYNPRHHIGIPFSICPKWGSNEFNNRNNGISASEELKILLCIFDEVARTYKMSWPNGSRNHNDIGSQQRVVLARTNWLS